MEGILIVLISLAIYFLPTILGYSKKKKNAGAILVLNLLLGWSIIGWVIALIWATTND